MRYASITTFPGRADVVKYYTTEKQALRSCTLPRGAVSRCVYELVNDVWMLMSETVRIPAVA